MWSMALYGAETWTLWKVEQKYLESFQMWCSRRKEISWSNHMRNKVLLRRVKEERNVLHITKQNKTKTKKEEEEEGKLTELETACIWTAF
jgi:hypothetical protein